MGFTEPNPTAHMYGIVCGLWIQRSDVRNAVEYDSAHDTVGTSVISILDADNKAEQVAVANGLGCHGGRLKC